ncbi:hypothetical protein AA0535_3038 [Asaia krungthepensis NRIC 0535]|uniref:Uncharacterized protein n=1 Tax=Asaia krungthepensis NRIC 0535 TaxID=1307925 RepID=A0ABQ0Q6Y6_9PROT|nr:hypothetical protein AA0535_3038 [Asaia krungthepensis NRIC 0535]
MGKVVSSVDIEKRIPVYALERNRAHRQTLSQRPQGQITMIAGVKGQTHMGLRLGQGSDLP